MKNNIDLKNIITIIIIIFFIYLIIQFINYCMCGNSTENFSNNQMDTNQIKVYNFNTTWCGYSLKFQPVWDKFTKSLDSSDNIIAIDAKCDDNVYDDLLDKYQVKGFPTIIIDHGDNFVKYNKDRTVNGLRSFLGLNTIDNIDDNLNNYVEPANVGCNMPNSVNNQSNSDKTMIYNFNTSWCGYSVRFQPIWDEFTSLITDPNIKAMDVKCDDDQNKDLCEKFEVEGYPTVIKVKNNNITMYDGPRTAQDLLNFVSS